MVAEKGGRGALAGGLPGHGLGAVLAELERRGVFRVRPGAAGAVEALGLVGAEQGAPALDHRLLTRQHARDRAQGAPAAGGPGIVPHPRSLTFSGFAHGSIRRSPANTMWPSARARATRVRSAS